MSKLCEYGFLNCEDCKAYVQDACYILEPEEAYKLNQKEARPARKPFDGCLYGIPTEARKKKIAQSKRDRLIELCAKRVDRYLRTEYEEINPSHPWRNNPSACAAAYCATLYDRITASEDTKNYIKSTLLAGIAKAVAEREASVMRLWGDIAEKILRVHNDNVARDPDAGLEGGL